MRRYRAVIGVLVFALMLAMGQTADAAKVRDRQQSRDTSTFKVVAADFGDENNWGHVEAYQTADGAFVGYLDWQGQLLCDEGDPANPDDDLYLNFSYMTFEEGYEPLPAREFSIGKRNSHARVVGNVIVGYGFDDQCAGDGGGDETRLRVVIDLESNGVRIRESNTSTAAGPDSQTTDKYSFAGKGATGFVRFVDEDGVRTQFAADGKIGTAKNTSTSRSG